MTTPEQPRAPMAPRGMDFADETLPRPAVSTGRERAAATSRANVPAAVGEPKKAEAATQQPAAWSAAAAPSRQNAPVTYIREHPRTAAAIGAGVLLGALGCAALAVAIDRNFFNRQAYGIGGGGEFSGPEYACGQAKDSGPLLNGATINTNGKGGAIVDDTVDGKPTQVAVIPANTQVTISGGIEYWLYPTDCTAGQINKQAINHARRAGFSLVPDYHQLNGVNNGNAINSALTARLSTAQEALRRQPGIVRAARSVGRVFGAAI